MKPSDFKANVLRIVFPKIIDVYDKELIPWFMGVSKPAFQSLVEKDKQNPLRQYDWAFLYLDESQLYQQARRDFMSKFLPDKDDAYLGLDIQDRNAKIFLYLTKRFMRTFSFDNSDEEIDEIFNLLEVDKNHFRRVSIAQFYNTLSVIQNNSRINDLLADFVHKANERSLLKAVKVDPSVLHLTEVKNRIEQLNPVKKNKLEGKIHTAKSIPHLTPDQRKQYLILTVFLNITASMGYLNPPKPIPNKLLQNVATELNVIPDFFDEERFVKTAKYYRNK